MSIDFIIWFEGVGISNEVIIKNKPMNIKLETIKIIL